jgi:iron(III) transport system ATP-binding protein
MNLELHGLVWTQGERRRTLAPGPLIALAGRTTMVVADGPADAEAFADVVLGLAWPRKGAIRLSGHEVTTRTPPERRIGLVPAGGCLSPHLTVEQNIAFGLRRPRAERRAHVAYVAERLGIGGLRLRLHHLSNDEILVVAVARAMCGNSPDAVVIEDRAGRHPCGAAARAMRRYPDLPVLVVGDDPIRAARLATPAETWEIIDADQP